MHALWFYKYFGFRNRQTLLLINQVFDDQLMSLAVGADPSSNNMDNKDKSVPQESNSSLNATDHDDDDDHVDENPSLKLGPQYTLKEQLEKDKDDESLRKWKEQLLGSVDINNIGETHEPEVKFLSVAILTADKEDLVLSIPGDGKPKGLWFTLKEGSHYRLKFSFQVSYNIVSGLRYTNTVWKTGVKVYGTKDMIGTFSPQLEPYAHEMPEETAPSGFLARGSYTAKSKFLDDDNKCHLEINYTFDIRKEWADVE